MNTKTKVLVIYLVLNLFFTSTVIFLTPTSQDSSSIEKSSSYQINVENDKNNNPQNSNPGPRSRGIIEQTDHGGSWMDFFEDDTGIDKSLSNDYTLENGEIKLDVTSYEKLFEDKFSTPLNTNKWINNTGGGTTLYTHPELKAVKNNQNQMFNAYVETKESWNSLRMVEWYWNSVLDDPWNGYGHTVYTFKGASKVLYVGIPADRSVLINDGIVYNLYNSTTTLTANQWYKMKMVINENNAEFEVKDMSDTVVIKTTVTSTIFPIDQVGTCKIVFAGASPSSTCSFDTRVDNFVINEKKFYLNGNVTSKEIVIPENKQWDALYFRKSEPSTCKIVVSILNSTSNLPIPGFNSIETGGELDISELNELDIESIKLKAQLFSDRVFSPLLHSWGVSWTARDTWRDTYFCGGKVLYEDGLEAFDGKSRCNLPNKTIAYLNSSVIELPDKYYYSNVLVNKTEPPGTNLLVSVFNAQTGYSIPGFEDLTGSDIEISSIDPIAHPKVQLRAIFTTSGGQTPELYDWSLNWLPEKIPYNIELLTDDQIVYRTASTFLTIDIFEGVMPESTLDINLFYQLAGEEFWEDDFVSQLHYQDDSWISKFEPDKSARLGFYQFKIECKDKYDFYTNETFENVLEVKNNRPGKPELEISPKKPRSTDDINLSAKNSIDIEDELVVYIYDWYKNNELQEHLKTEKVGFQNTSKGETWRCEVTPYDGNTDGYGTSNSTSVVILNSPPEISVTLAKVIMKEDEVDDSSIDLSQIFSDPDDDKINYSCYGKEHLEINIDSITGKVTITPEPNWYGEEELTFYANDTESDASITLTVVVDPQNDAPKLVWAGSIEVINTSTVLEFDVFEDKSLNLTLILEDIDGDAVDLTSNRTDKIGSDDISEIYIEKVQMNRYVLKFNPLNDHVGSIPVNLSLDDWNSSKSNYELIINVLNKNDLPSVEILYPLNGTHFREGEIINFNCRYHDEDLLIESNNEILMITWRSSKNSEPLGKSEFLTNLTEVNLDPGTHVITVTVRDKDGATSTASITIIIDEKEKQQDLNKSLFEVRNYWWIFLIIILIIMFLIATILYSRRRKHMLAEAEYMPPSEKETALPGTYVVTPGAIPAPTTVKDQAPSVPATVQIPITTEPAEVTPAALAGPAPPAEAPPRQLPPAPEQAPEGPEVKEATGEEPQGPEPEASPTQPEVQLQEADMQAEIKPEQKKPEP